RFEAAWRAPTIPVEEPGVTAFVASPRDLLLRVLGEKETARRRVFADALARGATGAADAARVLAERRAEAARLLGADLDALELPADARGLRPDKPGFAPEPPDPHDALASAAERVLAATAAFVDAPRGPWGDALARGVARSAGEGWPARLAPRWLFEL